MCFFKRYGIITDMESVRTKAYAKINLTLYVTGERDGYHCLDSLVTSVDLFDAITVKKRKDRLVSVTMHGMGSELISPESNNACRAAELFVEEFGTNGADITVYKNIPMGAGLGGSSADAAGVLNALQSLYKIDDRVKLKLIADKTGSDTRYMLTGGWARLFGRGDEVKAVESSLKLYLLMLIPEQKVSTAECFGAFDSTGKVGGNSDAAERAVIALDTAALAPQLSNALMSAAASLSEDIETCVRELKAFDPLAVNMTGSGSGVYALFENKEMCAYAKSRYRGKARAIILKTR